MIQPKPILKSCQNMPVGRMMAFGNAGGGGGGALFGALFTLSAAAAVARDGSVASVRGAVLICCGGISTSLLLKATFDKSVLSN